MTDDTPNKSKPKDSPKEKNEAFDAMLAELVERARVGLREQSEMAPNQMEDDDESVEDKPKPLSSKLFRTGIGRRRE